VKSLKKLNGTPDQSKTSLDIIGRLLLRIDKGNEGQPQQPRDINKTGKENPQGNVSMWLAFISGVMQAILGSAIWQLIDRWYQSFTHSTSQSTSSERAKRNKSSEDQNLEG
jgi:hypothetical protein